ncbi:hypothetical protein Syun_016074 [Stephania yunnanensis]|uniref:VWFA domain-containing protein n=1 Tax=Stephania yunnanensis TaxID=152371 RepID=A0AAP0J6Q9_9MAGN
MLRKRGSRMEKRKRRRKTMKIIWKLGKELMLMKDLGNPCKRMNPDFSAPLIVMPFTMLNTVVDFDPFPQFLLLLESRKAASETDFKPSRMAVAAKHVEAFIREFFDQNPLSHIALITIRDGVAQCLTDLGGSPDSHIKALMGKLGCSGDSSLQNALDLVHGYLNQIPSYGHREVLILYSALSTCDPGDIMETIQKCKNSKIRCSVVGLSAEIYICRHLCQETGGTYTVAMDEAHMKELLLEHAPPPPAIAEFAVSNLIKMGFPQRAAEGVVSICSCHKEAKVGGGYTCPRCKARVCELPTECQICGLTLVSSPHLARSYHHLFPITPFNDVSPTLPNSHKLPRACFGCRQPLIQSGNKPGLRVACPNCNQHFCLTVIFTSMRACIIALAARANETRSQLPWNELFSFIKFNIYLSQCENQVRILELNTRWKFCCCIFMYVPLILPFPAPINQKQIAPFLKRQKSFI